QEVAERGHRASHQRRLAAALPPLRPAAACWAWVPPCLEEPPPSCERLPPCSEASGEFAMRAARAFDIPLSLRASYCFSFFTCADLPGMGRPPVASSAYAPTQPCPSASGGRSAAGERKDEPPWVHAASKWSVIARSSASK